MKKTKHEILKKYVVRDLKNYVRYYLNNEPKVSEIDYYINYTYDNEMLDYILKSGIYKLLLKIDYKKEG